MTSKQGKRSLAVISCLAFCLASSLGYAKAPKGRYIIANGDVTDTKTGLIWRQTVNPNPFTFDEAGTHCAGLSGGYRTPNVRELMSITDESTGSPTVDEDAFPGTPPADMWTSTPDAGDAAYGWVVSFWDGTTGHVTKVTKNRVRCVR